jgi:hypothetical protein
VWVLIAVRIYLVRLRTTSNGYAAFAAIKRQEDRTTAKEEVDKGNESLSN